MIELKNAVNEAKIKLGLSNSELSKLIGYSRNYISETLRIGASTEKQAQLVKKIKEAVAVELAIRGVGISCDDEQTQNVRMLSNDLAIANRDKNYMKKKLKDKNLAINYLVATIVFLLFLLTAKCVGWL